ncbi:MAG: hypothetical protein ACI9J3_000807 [Parvicellaceae bacterium]|jgi:hypothetical protein
MKKYRYIIIAVIAFTLGSCENVSETNDSIVQSIHEDHDDNSIGLDDGKKWAVVPEMMKHVRSMESDLNQFEGQKDTEYTELAEKLKSNIDLLISSCTMSGEAHNQLHKWLVPYISLVDDLKASDDREEANKIYVEIRASLNSFNTYFE